MYVCMCNYYTRDRISFFSFFINYQNVFYILCNLQETVMFFSLFLIIKSIYLIK